MYTVPIITYLSVLLLITVLDTFISSEEIVGMIRGLLLLLSSIPLYFWGKKIKTTENQELCFGLIFIFITILFLFLQFGIEVMNIDYKNPLIVFGTIIFSFVSGSEISKKIKIIHH